MNKAPHREQPHASLFEATHRLTANGRALCPQIGGLALPLLVVAPRLPDTDTQPLQAMHVGQLSFSHVYVNEKTYIQISVSNEQYLHSSEIRFPDAAPDFSSQ